MTIYWMPYLKLTYPPNGPQEYGIGKAVFVDDTPENWTSLVGRPRPKHLEIHRDFPRPKGGDPPPIFGTIVRSDDPQWLSDYIDETVATLFFLGDDPLRGCPAERFVYYQLPAQVPPGADDRCAGYWTKHSQLIETSGSLKLHPPLSVRGHLSQFLPCTDQPEYQELLRRIDLDPHDRLVVAVRQYFRTQFTDIFTSPLPQDYALHCGAIEAALQIDSTKPGVGERFAKILAEKYGNGDRYEEFFYGLYVSRSLFVHGVSPQSASGSKEVMAYQMFRQARWNVPLMRAITHDVLCDALGRKKDPFDFWHTDGAEVLLATMLGSTVIWRCAKPLLTRAKAADRLTEMTDPDFKGIEELAGKFNDSFDWQCVEDKVEEKHILKAICTVALVIGRLTGSSGDVYVESDKLGKAACQGDVSAIESWILSSDPWRNPPLHEGGRLAPMQCIGRAMAKFFDKHNTVPWR